MHPFSQDEVDEIMYDNPEGWKTVEGPDITGQSRWHTQWTRVISNGEKFFRIYWATGSTEYQDNLEDIMIVEVKPIQVTVTQYVPAEES